jgi:hypothetical protein
VTPPTQSENVRFNGEQPQRLGISVTQTVASELAAVSATVAASFFGVAGTVIGAALGSLISVVGGAVYKHSIETTQQRIRAAAVESAVAQRFGLNEPTRAVGDAGKVDPAAVSGRRPLIWLRSLSPKRIALSAAALFLVILGGVTAFEMISGQPISSTVSNSNGKGTSLFGGTVKQSTPSPTTTSTSSSSAAAPSTAAPSASTSSAAPTVTTTTAQPPSDTASPTTSTSISPTGAAGASTGRADSAAPVSSGAAPLSESGSAVAVSPASVPPAG